MMPPIYSEQIFRWFTTPEELRRLANKMEADFPTRLPGESLIIESIVSPGCSLEICVDQEKFYK